MELLRQYCFRIWSFCNSGNNIVFRILIDFLQHILYWIIIGSITVLFVMFLFGALIMDLLMELFGRITRSFKKTNE
jgi:hypothetical protein